VSSVGISPLVTRHHPLFVIRRLDRRIQREGETAPDAEVVCAAGWVCRICRRTTREGAAGIGSPVKPANDEKRGVTGTDSLANVERARYRSISSLVTRCFPFVIRRQMRRIQRERKAASGAGTASPLVGFAG